MTHNVCVRRELRHRTQKKLKSRNCVKHYLILSVCVWIKMTYQFTDDDSFLVVGDTRSKIYKWDRRTGDSIWGPSLTFTNEQYVVVTEAHGTFTAEAPDLVYTHSAGTDTWYLPTLINVCTKKTKNINIIPAGLNLGITHPVVTLLWPYRSACQCGCRWWNREPGYHTVIGTQLKQWGQQRLSECS